MPLYVYNRFHLLLLLLFAQLNLMLRTQASVACQTTEECQRILRVGSECVQGMCTNPFQQGGCLKRMLEGWEKLRVCNSEDAPDAAERGFCKMPQLGLDYMEIRIATQNWESAFFEAWMIQILLSEFLDVPTTLETGTPNASLNFYDPSSPFQYGLSSDYDSLRKSVEVQDCRLVSKDPNSYTACAHLIPEVWNGELVANEASLLQEGIIEEPTGLGAVGEQNWYLPRFTLERDPTLSTYLGLRGEKNRRKLAATFLRPTSWKDYCDLVSTVQCRTDDGIARRPPQNETENVRMFVEGLYIGHFRKTEKNDCDKYPTNCTGHIVDYPCGWASYVKAQAYWNHIALEGDGPEASGGYPYAQILEIWQAANATKSNVVMYFWNPSTLYQSFIGTDAEFEKISLPPPTEDCVQHRVANDQRCGGTFKEQVGDSRGIDAHPLSVGVVCMRRV